MNICRYATWECDFVGFIHLIVVVEGKTILKLVLYYKIIGKGFIKGNSNTDNCYTTLRSYYLVHLVELGLYGKVVNINNLFPQNDSHKQNINTL